MGKTDKIVLSPKQESWLVKHFKHTKNDEIKSRLGQSHATLYRFTRELGLKKSRQFVRKCQAEIHEIPSGIFAQSGTDIATMAIVIKKTV